MSRKAEKLPQVERLLGASNCWFPFLYHIPEQEKRMEAVRYFKDPGMDRMIFSNGDTIQDATTLVEWGWIPSMYDLYSDVWPRETQNDCPECNRNDGYPEDVRFDFKGEMLRGWVVKRENGEFPAFNLCPTRHLKWAQKAIPPTLKNSRMLARLVDTTTALPLGECYHPNHPMTRKEDKAARLALLSYLEELKLLPASEIGVDWAVPVQAYSEGMLSPVAYRNPDAGYLPGGMQPVPDTFKYMLNPAVRVPLWELVYHDCHVGYWYWGDCNNTFPELWDKRNLFNALYATPPMYMILEKYQMYLDQRDKIVATDHLLRPLIEQIGFTEMTSHRFLSEDRLLQETCFAGGTRVVVNFSDTPREVDGETVAPMSFISTAVR
jgi:hypothetical protein